MHTWPLESLSINLNLIRDASFFFFCNRWWLTPRPLLAKVQRIMLRSSETFTAHPFFPKLTGNWKREDHRSLRARGSGWVQENSVFHSQQGSCTYKCTDVRAVCVRPTQAQAAQNPSVERGSGDKIPPLAKKLLAIDSLREREVTFPQDCGPW